MIVITEALATSVSTNRAVSSRVGHGLVRSTWQPHFQRHANSGGAFGATGASARETNVRVVLAHAAPVAVAGARHRVILCFGDTNRDYIKVQSRVDQHLRG